MASYVSVEDRHFLRVEEAGRRLLRIAALKKGLTRSLAGWLPRLPTFASKCHLSRHLYLDAKCSQAAAHRAWELQFGRGEFAAPDDLAPFLAVMDRAADIPEMLAGLYLTVKAELAAAYRRYMAETDRVFDHPTLDVLEPLLQEEERQIEWARGVLHRHMLSTERKAELAAWQQYLSQKLAACGGVLGDAEPDPAYEAPAAFADRPPYELPASITFADMPNHSVDADPGKVPEPHRLVYAYYQEIDIVDLLATILFDSPQDMPIAYFVDIARQTWDESRHTTMGIRRLRELGYDLSDCGWTTVVPRPPAATPPGAGCRSWSASRFSHRSVRRAASRGSASTSSAGSARRSHQQRPRRVRHRRREPASGADRRLRFGSKWMPELMKREGETRSRKEMAAHASLRYRQELKPLKVAAGQTVPENFLDPFQGCEDVRDPAQSF
jgi:hypothetical protein